MLVMWWDHIFLNTSVLHVGVPPGAGTVRTFSAAVAGTHCHHSAATA